MAIPDMSAANRNQIMKKMIAGTMAERARAHHDLGPSSFDTIFHLLSLSNLELRGVNDIRLEI